MNGDVGVAWDVPKATYYVVKVVKRDLPKDDQVALSQFHERFMKERFTGQLYPYDKTP